MSEHLNTPWTYNNDSGRVEGQHENPKMGSVHIADIRGWGYLTGLTEGYALGLSEAKALEVQRRRGELIAAAPDLLEAAQYARALIEAGLALQVLDPTQLILSPDGDYELEWAEALERLKAAIERAALAGGETGETE